MVKQGLEYTWWKKSLGKTRTEQFSHDLAFVGFHTMNKIIKAKDINKIIFIPTLLKYQQFILLYCISVSTQCLLVKLFSHGVSITAFVLQWTSQLFFCLPLFYYSWQNLKQIFFFFLWEKKKILWINLWNIYMQLFDISFFSINHLQCIMLLFI